MIRFQNVSLMRGFKPLLESADLSLNPGEKIGLIGINGVGKSSLFALLRNELHADLGNINFPKKWRVAHVAQDIPALSRSALDYAIDGDTRVRELQAQLNILDKAEDTNENGIQIGALHAALADANFYTLVARAEALLLGLGFSLGQTRLDIASFSGGWRMRLNLAQALMCPSDLLLLDEPTNHLDLDAILWLEDWLKRYTGTLIIISHDRDFLDGVVNVIVQIDECKLRRYGGNYSLFEYQRAAQLALASANLEKQTRKRTHLESFITRFKAKASKARQAQSRIKALEKMEELAPLRAAAEFSFEFRECVRAPNPLLVLDEVNAGYRNQANETTIIQNICFSLQTEQRIGLLGINGAGKSTLIKTIATKLKPLSGTMTLGKGLVIGYFAQHQLETLRLDESPLWHLKKIAPDTREQELRNFLGSFNFPGEMATSPVTSFSGGEKSRLAMALIVWKRPNLLLLDEPTNHLDLETREALTEALAQFEGTVILVSHDRHLLRACTDQLYIVADGHFSPFDGDLDDYRDWILKSRNTAKEVKTPPAKSSVEQRHIGAPKKQELANQRKLLEKKITQIEVRIAELSLQKEAFDEKLGAADIYAPEHKEQLSQLLREQRECISTLEALEYKWLFLQEQIEKLK